jgi:hypothetical protein
MLSSVHFPFKQYYSISVALKNVFNFFISASCISHQSWGSEKGQAFLGLQRPKPESEINFDMNLNYY